MRIVTATFFALSLAAAAGCHRTDRSQQTQPSEDNVQPAPTSYGGGPKSDSTDQSGGTDQAKPGNVDNAPMGDKSMNDNSGSSDSTGSYGGGVSGGGATSGSASSATGSDQSGSYSKEAGGIGGGPSATKDGGVSSSPATPDMGSGLTGPGTDINGNDNKSIDDRSGGTSGAGSVDQGASMGSSGAGRPGGAGSSTP